MNGLQRRGAGGRGRRPAAALLAAGALLGMVLASGLMAGCASRHHDDDHPAARGGPSLPPGVVQLTPAQQTAAGVRLATVESRQVPRQVALPAQVEAPTGDSASARAGDGLSARSGARVSADRQLGAARPIAGAGAAGV